MLHDDSAAPRRSTRSGTGLECVVCLRRDGKAVQIVIEKDGKRIAEEPAALCAKCWKDRFQLCAAVERATRRDT